MASFVIFPMLSDLESYCILLKLKKQQKTQAEHILYYFELAQNFLHKTGIWTEKSWQQQKFNFHICQLVSF